MNERAQKITKLVSLGAGNTGLATVGYTLKNGDGTTFQARTTTGVYEIGAGWYGVELGSGIFTGFFEGRIDWDIATVFKASDELYISADLDAAVSTRLATSGYTAPDNSDITAIKAKTDLIPAAGPPDAAHYTNARGDKLDDLDAAVSTRLATSGYTAPDNADVAAIKAKTDNLPADPASEAEVEAAIPSAATIAATVWAALTSALTTNGSIGKLLATDIDAAISSRSTYAGGDTPGTTTLLSRLTATRAGLLDNLDAAISGIPAAVWASATRTLSSVTAIATGVWDELLSGHTVSGSAGADLAAAAAGGDAPTVEEIVDGVWDEPLSGHTTPGTAGKTLAAAGSAGDPWTTILPGDYNADEAGAILSAIQDKTALITTGTKVTLVAPVTATGSVALIQGDDYKAEDGRSLQWSSDSWPVITGATLVLDLVYALDTSVTETFDASPLSATEAQVELTDTQTTSLKRGGWRYALRATLTDGSIITLATGRLLVAEKP